MLSTVWEEIANPFPNFNGAAVMGNRGVISFHILQMNEIIYSCWKTGILISRWNNLHCDVCFWCQPSPGNEADVINAHNNDVAGMIHSTCITVMYIDNVIMCPCEHITYNVSHKIGSMASIEIFFSLQNSNNWNNQNLILRTRRVPVHRALLEMPLYLHFVDNGNILLTLFALKLCLSLLKF